MQNIIAVFKNRNQALQLATILKRLGIINKIVDTPRELSSYCGISVVFNIQYLGKVKSILEKSRLTLSVRMYIISGDLFKKYLPIR